MLAEASLTSCTTTTTTSDENSRGQDSVELMMKRHKRTINRRPPAELMPTSNKKSTEFKQDHHQHEQQQAKDSTALRNRHYCNLKLLELDQIPSHLRFNKYVLTHYRPATNWVGCLRSLFYLHNETVNILTHAIPVVAILAAIPWMLPWEEITVPYLPTFHVLSSVAPWIGSTIYHLFMNHHHGYSAYKLLLTIDMLGIWVTQTGGGLVTICATIHCLSTATQTGILVFYGVLCLYCLYKAITAKCPWGRRFCFTAPFLVRMYMVTLRYFGLGGGHSLSFPHVILQDAVAVVGAVIGATNIPERWFPGTLDLVCNSHHVMHVLVVYAVYQMHLAATLDLQWMTNINTGADKCGPHQEWLEQWFTWAS